MDSNDLEDASLPGPLSASEQAALLDSIERVARVAQQALAPLRASSGAIRWIHHLHDNVDTVFGRHVASGVTVSCRKGCSHCCQVRVEALPPEIFRIADYLCPPMEAHPDAQEARLSLVQTLQDHVQLLEQSAADHTAPPMCPFLVNQLCAIYPVRPSVCRKGHSLDVQACESHAPTVPQSLGLLADAEALIQGTSRAYAEQGLQSGGHQLAAGVLLVLQDPTAQQRWLAGEAVFAAD